MLGVAGEHALQRHVVFAEELRAAARLVRDREHAVDVGIIARDVAELVLHELADARRAVDAGDDRDVVARANAAVFTLVPIEVPHPVGAVVLDGLHVHADLVAIGGQVPDAEVLRVNVVTDRDVGGRETDDLTVAAHRLAHTHRTARDFVAGPDGLAHLDPRAAILEHGPRGQLGPGDGDVVFGLEQDRLVGERVRRHLHRLLFGVTGIR